MPNFYVAFSEIGSDPDKRNYIVSNQRLREAGFEARRSLDDGIRELLRAYRHARRSAPSERVTHPSARRDPGRDPGRRPRHAAARRRSASGRRSWPRCDGRPVPRPPARSGRRAPAFATWCSASASRRSRSRRRSARRHGPLRLRYSRGARAARHGRRAAPRAAAARGSGGAGPERRLVLRRRSRARPGRGTARSAPTATLVLVEVPDTSRYGRVEVERRAARSAASWRSRTAADRAGSTRESICSRARRIEAIAPDARALARARRVAGLGRDAACWAIASGPIH